MSDYTIPIPFPVVRAFLPPDGERIVVWNGKKNQWPKNPAGFQRDETVVVAFGRYVRANPDDRDDEASAKPGIECRDNCLHIRGGWAAHRAVSFHSDYFDGRFSADVFLSLKAGEVFSDVRNFQFTWNAHWVAKLVDFTGLVRGLILSFIRSKVQDALEAELRKVVSETIAKMIPQHPDSPIGLEDISVDLDPGVIRILIKIEAESSIV